VRDEWFTFDEAIEILSFSNLKDILRKAHHKVYDLLKGRKMKDED